MVLRGDQHTQISLGIDLTHPVGGERGTDCTWLSRPFPLRTLFPAEQHIGNSVASTHRARRERSESYPYVLRMHTSM